MRDVSSTAEEPMVCTTLCWRGQSPANPSLESDSLVTGKNTGNLSRIATGTLLILRDIKDLPIEFPSS